MPSAAGNDGRRLLGGHRGRARSSAAGKTGTATRRYQRLAAATQLNPHLAFPQIDLAEIVLLHQLHQTADLAEIENISPHEEGSDMARLQS